MEKLINDSYYYIVTTYKKHGKNTMEKYTLTKQISKQGTQSIIIIPTILKEKLKPKTLVEVKIKVIGEDQK